ncbi:hypothetical protein AMEX_G13990 [Astyanax mexicanus]|uniref:Uncharacterized protein n=1 Tax=Astyanax mexicanus TaxID=7994 RepID=A0A8T2LQN7_ASTMX|nr:hypothetical protein AMEX_G13990 [Astyanax mexicanus]
MGCAPSKSTLTYTHERVCGDLDTCSTFVPSLKSSVSTPERPSPRLCVETTSGKQTFLSVPGRECCGRSGLQPPCSPFRPPPPSGSTDSSSSSDSEESESPAGKH